MEGTFFFSLKMIAELSNASVYIRDRRRVEDILGAMRDAGPDALQVISDFDMTLTRFAHDGKRCPTCHSILHSSTLIGDECRDTLRKLCDTYYPIEIDASRSVEEKLPLMVEWWTRAHDLLVQQKIKKSLLAARVHESGVMLRGGYRTFFERLRQRGIPLLIFSAGIGDVLEEVIRQAGVFHANVSVLSNYMDFDEAGELRAFKGQLIHTYNKRDGSLQLGAGRFRELRARPNVLLLGDSLGDLSMADGVQDMQNILKVGFLNDKVEERRQSYLNSYDIVLVKDETLDVANSILCYLTGDK